MPGFDVDAYFRNIVVLNQALAERGSAFRDTHADADAAGEHVLLWLGCNLLRTPHLARLAAEVMRLAGLNLSMLGGPAHCCGSPYSNPDDRQRSLDRAVSHFRSEGAPTLVSWCPSCHTNIRAGSDSSTWGFDELHITEFLANRLARFQFRFPVPVRVMLHGHTGAPDRDKDMDCCRKLLQSIPGLTIAGEHRDSDLGIHCVPALLAPRLGMDAVELRFAGVLDKARESGADLLVTIYHSCYRELEKRSAGIGVENYITFFAKALGLPIPPNVYRELAHGGEEKFAEVAACAGPPDRSEVEAALHAEFPRARR